ncbi:MAG: TonB-dependent receptor [Bacteroidota bacterium]
MISAVKRYKESIKPKTIITWFCVYLITAQFNAFAQSDCKGKIRGKILDIESGEPLPFATIKILESSIGVIADDNGDFVLENICGKEVDLEIRFLGYQTIVHHHDFRAFERKKIQHKIYLAEEENLLESVVVEGEKIVGDLQSMSVAKIDKAELATKSTETLASAIGGIQGVSFTSTGSNVQLPVIHGLYGNRILIINNGVKHGFQNWGTDHAPEIDVASAENISVIKGAAGVRYGPEALGGVVVIEGNPLQLQKEMYGSLATGYQTNGRGYFGTGSFGAGYENFSFHVGGNYEKLGDRRTESGLLWNTGMEEISANAGFRYHLPDWDFKAYYSYVEQNLGLFRGSIASSLDLFSRLVGAEEPFLTRDFSYKIDEPNQDVAHHLAKVEVDWFSRFGRFSLLVSQQINNRQEFDVRRNADRPIIDLTLNTTDNRLEWYHPTLAGLEGSVGIQYFSQNNDNNPGTNVIPFVPNYNTYRFSAFAIESLQKGKNTFELGLRLDHERNSVRGREQDQSIFRNEFSFTNVTTSLGIVRDISSVWQIRTNLGTAWRTPNMAELYSFGQHGFKIEYGLWRYEGAETGQINTIRILNGSDKPVPPEKGYKWINEVSRKKDGSRVTLTSYINYIDNFIFDRPSGVGRFFWGPGPQYIYDQADVLLAGADLTYKQKLTNSINGTLGASYLWSQNIDRIEPLINQPPLKIDGTISLKTPVIFENSSSKFTIQSTYVFRQFYAPRTIQPEFLDPDLEEGKIELTLDSPIFDFKDVPEAFFLTHVTWDWSLMQFSGNIQARNVFDISYRDYLNEFRLFHDELGRNFIVSLKYNF